MISRKFLAALSISLCSLASHAQISPAPAPPAGEEATWFAIMGNFGDAADTVELNLADVQPRGQTKSMNLRVNLGRQRTMASGEKFTSYKSIIAIDCEKGGVFHIKQTRYVGPHWTGEETTQYFGNNRPMAFEGLTPSPKPKVLKAAC